MSTKLHLIGYSLERSPELTLDVNLVKDSKGIFFFFFLHANKNLQYGFTSYTTYRILNYTTRTMPLGAKCYDYSVASQKTKTIYI